MKIALLSDIHGYTPNIGDVDMAIFCGDFVDEEIGDVKAELKTWNTTLIPYFQGLRQRGIKLVGCPGNHDFLANGYTLRDVMSDNFDMFIDCGIVNFEGFNFLFFAYCDLEDWSMFLPKEEEIRRCERLKIAATKTNIDFMVTHRPARHILDSNGVSSYGSLSIRSLLCDVRPKYFHCFGHIHESFGCMELNSIDQKYDKNNTMLINCSYCDRNYDETCRYYVYDTNKKSVSLWATR